MKTKFSAVRSLFVAFTITIFLMISGCGSPNDGGNSANFRQNSQDTPKSGGNLEKTLILTAKDGASFKKVEQTIKAEGGRITAAAPPEIILALISAETQSQLRSLKEVRFISSQPIEIEKQENLETADKTFLNEWNERFSRSLSPDSIPNVPPPPNDALESLP